MNIEVVNLNARIVGNVRGSGILTVSEPKIRTVVCGETAVHHHHRIGQSRLKFLTRDHSDGQSCPADQNPPPQQIR